MKNINILFTVAVLFLGGTVSAQFNQFVISSLGGSIQTANAEIQFVQSIGEIAGMHKVGTNVNFSQGFPQCLNCGDCSNVDAVEANPAKVSFQLFPNPVNDKLQVKGDFEEIQQYQIFNALGELIINKTFSTPFIDIQNLPKGLYTIRFVDKKGHWISTEKIIRQ